ncbi:MAG: Murein DD-endopeptidase MepM [Syntrophus sp. PtaB.Bin001]|nr:MAG: Murein DD-endopeptidase MepM [Syntrophus sp. PtaB.Bin001]
MTLNFCSRFLTIICFLFSVSSILIDHFSNQVIAGTIYKYRDQNGIIHLTNIPTEERFRHKEIIHYKDSGSIDSQLIRKNLNRFLQSSTIKEYLNTPKDSKDATPKGIPVPGRISSSYGNRVNPVSGRFQVHKGVDMACEMGTPIRATADGIVVFSGWSGGSGNLVVLEHGLGFSTCYAHNMTNIVQPGQKVQRGDAIAYVGSTGYSTGPHVHYEIWENGIPIDPSSYLLK